MALTPENSSSRKDEMTDNNAPLDGTLAPIEALTDEQRKLWDAYREQQRRRSCPGCGDDDSVF